MLESYFEAIRYFKKIINYQSEETSCLAYTWDGLVLEVWNIPSINRCDLGHQFPYIKPRGRNRFHHLILYQPLRSDDIFQRLCAFFFNLNQVFRSQRPLTKEQQYNRQDYTQVCLICIYFFGLIRNMPRQLTTTKTSHEEWTHIFSVSIVFIPNSLTLSNASELRLQLPLAKVSSEILTSLTRSIRNWIIE